MDTLNAWDQTVKIYV